MAVTRIRDETLKEMVARLPENARGNKVMESLGLANSVVRAFLTNRWANEYVVPNARRRSFLTIDESTPQRREITLYRVIDFAEILVNLQWTPGFDGCVRKLKRGDLEGTYAELDLGRLLYMYKVPFSYVTSIGRKRADYDVEITFPDGTVACTEAKCKVESTIFDARKVFDSLERARAQLPNDRPGIAFVKVPQHWLTEPDFRPLMQKAAADFLQDSPNIVSVKYYLSHLSFELHPIFPEGVMRHQHAFEEIANPTNTFDRTKDWKLFYHVNVPPDWHGMPPHWKRILFYPDGKIE
jgi:hypothetical protein